MAYRRLRRSGEETNPQRFGGKSGDGGNPRGCGQAGRERVNRGMQGVSEDFQTVDEPRSGPAEVGVAVGDIHAVCDRAGQSVPQGMSQESWHILECPS